MLGLALFFASVYVFCLVMVLCVLVMGRMTAGRPMQDWKSNIWKMELSGQVGNGCADVQKI